MKGYKWFTFYFIDFIFHDLWTLVSLQKGNRGLSWTLCRVNCNCTVSPAWQGTRLWFVSIFLTCLYDVHLGHILFALLMVRKLEFFINERSTITMVLTDLDTLFFLYLTWNQLLKVWTYLLCMVFSFLILFKYDLFTTQRSVLTPNLLV